MERPHGLVYEKQSLANERSRWKKLGSMAGNHEEDL